MPKPENLARRLFAPLLGPTGGRDQAYVIYTEASADLLGGRAAFSPGQRVAIFMPKDIDVAVYVPISIFGLRRTLCIIVAWLGSERAIARCAGNRK